MGMTPSVTDLGDSELGRLHERLLAGDPVAPAELAERLLPLLRARLAGWAATIDDQHMVDSAVGLVIARYLADPARFDPDRGGLAAYLAMEVRGDVRNELDSRRRRRRHESPVAEPVELEPHGRDSTVEEEALDAVDPIGVSPAAVQAARQALGELDQVDRRMLEMMAEGVRPTSVYAALLGISHLPVDVQAKAVKKHKDRLQKRLERLRGRLS
jgi:RNA polymerase sigma-70 factor, ECF subfamily